MARRLSIPAGLDPRAQIDAMRGRSADFSNVDDSTDGELPNYHMLVLDPTSTLLITHHAHRREEPHEGVELSTSPELRLASMLMRFRPLLKKAAKGGFGAEGNRYSTPAGLRHWTLVCVPIWGSGKVVAVLCFMVDTTIAHAEPAGDDVPIVV